MLVFPMITIGIPNAGQDADSGLLQWVFFGVGGAGGCFVI